MLWLNFKKFDSSHKRVFTLERYYYKGKWTPLVKVTFRYLSISSNRIGTGKCLFLKENEPCPNDKK